VLRLIWEGIIIEYWRSLGKSIKHYKFDLRRMVWTYWLRGREEAENPSDEWIPIYTPLEDRPDRVVEERVTDDDRVSTWVKGMTAQEKTIKDAERHLRLCTFRHVCVWYHHIARPARACLLRCGSTVAAAISLADAHALTHTNPCVSCVGCILRALRCVVSCFVVLCAAKDYTALMTLLGGHARLRHYEAHGREAMLADLQLVRKHLETANKRNHTLFEQMNNARDTLVTCEEERLSWRKKYQATEAVRQEVVNDMSQLRTSLGYVHVHVFRMCRMCVCWCVGVLVCWCVGVLVPWLDV